MFKKKPTAEALILALQERVSVLEKKPDILSLNPDETYIVVVPESTLPTDFDSLLKALRQHPNVVLIQADQLKIVSIA